MKEAENKLIQEHFMFVSLNKGEYQKSIFVQIPGFCIT